MPTSYSHLIPGVVDAVQGCAVRYGLESVLDLGCGAGAYGFLLRHYIDHVYNRMKPEEWQLRLVGVEGYEGFRTAAWDAYDEVLIEPIQEYLARGRERFDVVLLLDVLEHFELPEAYEALGAAYAMTDKFMIVSSPSVFREQWHPPGKPWGTELQERHSLITPDMLEALFGRVQIIDVSGDESVWLGKVINEYLEI